MEERTYGVDEVVQIIGVPRRTLHRWHCEGWLVASAKSLGGHHRRYTEADLRRARIIMAMRDAGLRGMEQVSRAADIVMETLDPEREPIGEDR